MTYKLTNSSIATWLWWTGTTVSARTLLAMKCKLICLPVCRVSGMKPSRNQCWRIIHIIVRRWVGTWTENNKSSAPSTNNLMMPTTSTYSKNNQPDPWSRSEITPTSPSKMSLPKLTGSPIDTMTNQEGLTSTSSWASFCRCSCPACTQRPTFPGKWIRK